MNSVMHYKRRIHVVLSDLQSGLLFVKRGIMINFVNP